MPLVYRDEEPPQASVHKSTTWTLPAGSVPWESPHHRSPGARCRGRAPGTVVSVCANDPGVSSMRRPALHPPTRTADSRPVDTPVLLLMSVSSLCGGFLSIQTTMRTSLVYTVIPFWKLEASNWDDSAEQKWVRVMTIEVFFLGRKRWLWVSCMTVLWETSKEHHSQFGIFKECSSPQRGSSLKSVLAFIKTLCKLGKLIEVRKRSEKDKKAKTPAKQAKEKRFSFTSIDLNDIRHLWKLAWTLNVHVPSVSTWCL